MHIDTLSQNQKTPTLQTLLSSFTPFCLSPPFIFPSNSLIPAVSLRSHGSLESKKRENLFNMYHLVNTPSFALKNNHF